MTRRHLMTLTLLLMLADLVVASAVFVVVSVVRFEADPTAVWSVGIDVAPASLLFGLLWVVTFLAVGAYRLRVRWSLLAEAKDIGRGTLLALALTLSLLFLFRQLDVSRVFLGLLFVAEPIAMLGSRALLRAWFEGRRQRGRDTNYMLVVGAGSFAQAFADRVEAHRAIGIEVLGHLTVPDESPGELTRPVLGSVDDMHRTFRERVVDEVAVCLPPHATRYLDAVVTVAAEEGKTVRVPRMAEEGVLATAVNEEFDGFLVQSVVHGAQREIERALKRVVDVVGSLVALVVLSPVLVAVTVAIRLADGPPVIFRQTRIGLHGRPFTILKFRTMAVDAEERYDELAALSDTKGAAFKMDKDPRVTTVGRFLRKWTLDELPQLFNVLVGDMSLVGPRPAPPREVEQYDIWHRRRLSVRPGMTGLWQVEARFDQHFDDRAELDLRYIDQWSLWKDLSILVRTVPAVLTPRGR